MKRKISKLLLLIAMLSSVFVIGASALYWNEWCPSSSSIYIDFSASHSLTQYDTSGGWGTISATLRAGRPTYSIYMQIDYYIVYSDGTFNDTYNSAGVVLTQGANSASLSTPTFYRNTSKAITRIDSLGVIQETQYTQWRPYMAKYNGVDFTLNPVP